MSGTEDQRIRDLGRIGIRVPSVRESARTQGWRALGRVLISGYVDSYTLLHFGVYASFMTGNTTSGGLHAGQANLAAAGHSLLPIPFFVLGILAGTLLAQTDQHHALARLSALVAVMLTVGVAAAYFAWPGWLSIMILSTAMGVMNTSITAVGGQAVSLGFMTGDLNNLAQHLAMGITREPVAQAQGSWDTHWRRAALLAGLWTAFLLGAVLGAALASRFAVWTLLLPALMLLVLAPVERATIADA
jgi:uncharacterized membrane protein YoaK (UPF0700 family)